MIPILLLATVSVSWAYEWAALQFAVSKAIYEGVFHGCVVGVATHNETILKKAFGTIGPKYGLYSPGITTEMRFDLGALTEPVGINAVLMEQIDDDQIMLINKIGTLYSDFKNNGKTYVTVQNLLEHNSGLQATYEEPFPATPDDLIAAINKLPLQYKTENRSLYSELGSIVLGRVISKVTEKSLPDALFQILTIMGMRDTVYRPPQEHYRIAPSGYTRGVAWGTPYNPLAHFLNDTAGNAGLFSTVADVLKYMQIMLNKGRLEGSLRIFSENVVNKFLTVTKYRNYTNTRALGWETIPKESICPCGSKFSASPSSFGASDPGSGSYIWGDLGKNVTIVVLANGAFPAGHTNDPRPYQAAISDAIMDALGY